MAYGVTVILFTVYAKILYDACITTHLSSDEFPSTIPVIKRYDYICLEIDIAKLLFREIEPIIHLPTMYKIGFLVVG
jgi:hypothetical protein